MVFPASYFTAHKTHALQHHHMLGNGIQRNGKGFGNLVDCSWMFGKHSQNRAARRIAERREDPVEFTSLVIFTHMGEYNLHRSSLSTMNTKPQRAIANPEDPAAQACLSLVIQCRQNSHLMNCDSGAGSTWSPPEKSRVEKRLTRPEYRSNRMRGAGLQPIPRDTGRFPFPPGIPILALILSWILGKLWPIEVNWPSWTRWAGWILVTIPFLFAIWAVITFRRKHTVVNPRGQVTTIVTAGPFQYSRNPMYVTLLAVYIGGTFAFRLPWALLLLLPVFLLLQFVVIIPEEKYLESSFGEEYISYKRSVRRWL